MGARLTLVAGAGALVPHIASAARGRYEAMQVIDLVGRGDIAADRVLHLPLSNARAVMEALKSFGTTHAVLAGAVHISDAEREGLVEALGSAGRLARSMGDIGIAGGILLYSRMIGVKLLAAQDIAPDLLAPSGTIAGPPLAGDVYEHARSALAAARAIGRIDLGQSIVFSRRRPVAAEDAGGTDAMLQRVIALREAGIVGDGSGRLILAKAMKPKQPRFADLPAIGPQTVKSAAAAGIGVIAVEAGRSLLLDKAELVAVADAVAVSVIGLRTRHG